MRLFLASFLLLPALLALAAPNKLDEHLLESLQPLGHGEVGIDDERPLLLQFWASWCHSCGSLMWDLDELAGDGRTVNYIAISLDESHAAATDYLGKNPLFRQHPERFFRDANRALANSLDILSVPTVLLVAPDGQVLLSSTGHLVGKDLAAIAAHIRDADEQEIQ